MGIGTLEKCRRHDETSFPPAGQRGASLRFAKVRSGVISGGKRYLPRRPILDDA